MHMLIVTSHPTVYVVSSSFRLVLVCCLAIGILTSLLVPGMDNFRCDTWLNKYLRHALLHLYVSCCSYFRAEFWDCMRIRILF